MIRVLIVDDEKIVRKGIATFMPWQDYGMVVVGEANNGEKALQFMESNKVDLMLTDLSMPVMSGIELMRETRTKYPHIQIVVLTLHQSFEYVQEALRLGAVDYISKTQLEQERLEDVLGRIAALMRQKGTAQAPAVPNKGDLSQADEAYVLYKLADAGDEAKPDDSLAEGAVEADAGVWYWTARPQSVVTGADAALVCFRNLAGLDHKSVMHLLRVYRNHDLFYDYDPAGSCIVVPDSGTVLERNKEEASFSISEFKQSWLSSEWIFDEVFFEQRIQELKAMRLPPIRLARMFYTLTDDWNKLYQHIVTEPIEIEDTFASWFRFERWLREARERLLQSNLKPQYSVEIQASITKAMNMVQQMMDKPASAAEMAQLVNMSGSYFSQCFKQITGQTYTDYLRDMRIERAKELLRNTTKTIQWIAEQIGYNDEKYFSRLFRDHAGMLPSEYRKQNRP
ncbi:two-component system response regulator YesN [Paenibacillus phyllosphaerae]|uniref:Two-component system response regulator YesN n=1 Tax=Paenibacillus phyllosphaerae TaxID=274593 RepID=A0A7W5ASN2_9BACL|nr:response regulator [Paenibacillus phyllosphaerae]MBB3108003.1 two-component system response regulator YesN [Paenibacillus phyllosphaerae]